MIVVPKANPAGIHSVYGLAKPGTKVVVAESGVPVGGYYQEIFNSDAEVYGGTNIGNGGGVRTLDEGATPEVSLVIPPLAAIFLVCEP